MKNFNDGSKKISWVSILNAAVQALIAALTALGVSSCANGKFSIEVQKFEGFQAL